MSQYRIKIDVGSFYDDFMVLYPESSIKNFRDVLRGWVSERINKEKVVKNGVSV